MFALVVYNLLLLVLSPVLLVFLLVRLMRGKEDKSHWAERWGVLPLGAATQTGSPRIWVHAVSVGEVMAAAPVLRELRARFPDAVLLLSTTTIGGREVAQKQIPPADFVTYYPLDFLPAIWFALRSFRPDAIVLMEWEIWPNFLSLAKRRGAKIAVLNGRISDKGLARGKKATFWTKPALHAVDAFAMQSTEDARRAVLVGAPQSRVQTVGNTKFDEAAHPLSEPEIKTLCTDLGLPKGVPVWVCGSTRPGEEEIIADAVAIIRETLPEARLIVAPRHLDRANDAAAPFEKAGFAVVRRSSSPPNPLPEAGRGSLQYDSQTAGERFAEIEPIQAPPSRFGEGVGWRGQYDILLLDTFGELARVYAVAQVAFVGGSLLPFGGQSVFQPLAQGVPAVFGPFMNNQRDIAALSQAEGVGVMVETNAQVLADAVLRLLLLPPNERAAVSDKARGLIARNQGVSRQCVQIVADLLGAA